MAQLIGVSAALTPHSRPRPALAVDALRRSTDVDNTDAAATLEDTIPAHPVLGNY